MGSEGNVALPKPTNLVNKSGGIINKGSINRRINEIRERTNEVPRVNSPRRSSGPRKDIKVLNNVEIFPSDRRFNQKSGRRAIPQVILRITGMTVCGVL